MLFLIRNTCVVAWLEIVSVPRISVIRSVVGADLDKLLSFTDWALDKESVIIPAGAHVQIS